MDISVITVNYNVKDFLHSALVSIFKALKGMRGEVFVVDNASDDGSSEMVHQSFPRVHLIENFTNVGFAKANNQALARARGKYLLLINPDTVVQEGTFRTLIKFFQDNPDVGMAGCKILNPDGTLQLACRRGFPTPWTALTKVLGLGTLFPSSRLFAKYNLTYLNPDESYEVDAVSGSFMMVRRDVYEQIGGLDETFFMYGEDLDWCYRVQRAGWKVFYVSDTQIIHYKGESTRRSDIDELRLFYQAMRLFVRKHHRGSLFFEAIIEFGILARAFLAFIARFGKPLSAAVADVLLVDAAILSAALYRTGRLHSFPDYAYPWVFIIPALVVVASLYFSGVYSYRRFSVSRSFAAVFMAFIVISAITAFFLEFAFSRMVVILSGVASVLAIPGWRILLRLFGIGGRVTRKTLFGKRTLIVGVGKSGKELLKKIQSHPGDGYTVVGFIDNDRRHLGKKISGVEIIGSIENVGKVIQERKISEVIFSTDALPYSTILSVIGKSRNRMVNFRLVPKSLEVIIGKANVDQLDEIPFIDIEYNINKFSNRVAKRTMDIVIALFLLICCAPFVYLKHVVGRAAPSDVASLMRLLPHVLRGSLSVVGLPMETMNGDRALSQKNGVFLGKPGITGILQIHSDTNDPSYKQLSGDEREQYLLYYAKNQSLILDFEILLKATMRRVHRAK
ncbi:MAG: glycosyltransferase [Bacteroidota bacterium]|nr:glycosyltransferase [Bacteroidota bacterium]